MRPRTPKKLQRYYLLTRRQKERIYNHLNRICEEMGAAEADITYYNELTGRRHTYNYMVPARQVNHREFTGTECFV